MALRHWYNSTLGSRVIKKKHLRAVDRDVEVLLPEVVGVEGGVT